MIPIKTTIADAEIQLAGMQPELQRCGVKNAKALIEATYRAEANIATSGTPWSPPPAAGTSTRTGR